LTFPTELSYSVFLAASQSFEAARASLRLCQEGRPGSPWLHALQ